VTTPAPTPAPDIVIGAHPEHRVVARNHTAHPSAAFLLRRLGFERAESGMWPMTPADEDPTVRAARTVALLRTAGFAVTTDLAFEPEPGTMLPRQPAPAPAPTEKADLTRGAKQTPNVAFGRLDTGGIAAAITDHDPLAETILRVSGFRRDPAKNDDLLRLPDGIDDAQASEIVHWTAKLLRTTGSNVHVVPGTTTAPTPAAKPTPTTSHERTDETPTRDGPVAPGQERGLVAALRRLLQILAGRARQLGTTAANVTANGLTASAARLARVETVLTNAGERLRAHAESAPSTPRNTESTTAVATIERLTAALAEDPSPEAVVRTLDALTTDAGPLSQVKDVLAKTASACAALPGEHAALMTQQLK